MNYNKLRYFYTVAQTLNFTKAAEELYISQSAVSRHMKELEEDFGVPLFQRTNRDLILTPAGKTLLDEIQYFFSRENEIYQKVRESVLGEYDQFNIGFMGIKPAYHIPAIVNQLVLKYPSLNISLRRYNWDDIFPALKCKEIDIALRLRMEPFENSIYEHFVLDNDYPAMVVSDHHPMANKKKVPLAAFKNDTFLMLSKKDSALPYNYTKQLFQTSGFIPKNYTEYDQVETILMLIHSGAGVSLLSRFAATDQFQDLKVIELSETDPIYLELVWNRSNKNPNIDRFVELMSESYQPN